VALSLWSLVAGACWGGVAYLLGGRSFGPSIWPGVLVAPIIGLLVGRLIQPRFVVSSGLGRALWVLLSLYFGAVLFAIPIGVAEDLRLWGDNHRLGAATSESILAVLWGTTLFLLALWPLAYLTHWLLEWRLE
jgi:hypothetical protein